MSGLGLGISEEQSDQGSFTCSVLLQDAVPWKGTDLTQHIWLFAATQAASWGQFCRQGTDLWPEGPAPPPRTWTKGSLPPTLKGRTEGTEGEKIACNLKNKVLGKKFYLLSVTWLR